MTLEILTSLANFNKKLVWKLVFDTSYPTFLFLQTFMGSDTLFFIGEEDPLAAKVLKKEAKKISFFNSFTTYQNILLSTSRRIL